MKKFCIGILIFAVSLCYSEPDLSGRWFVFLEKAGMICFRTDYDCVIKENKAWVFVRHKDGSAELSGSLIFISNRLYLEVQTHKKKTGDKNSHALPVSSWSSSEFRLMDPLFGSVLVFIPAQKVLPKSGNLYGTWQFHQKNPETGKTRHAPFKIKLEEKGRFSVSFKDKRKPDEPEKGTYEFKNGFLKLFPEYTNSSPFWNTPVFFFHDEKLVMNRTDVYVYGEKE